ncbi:MAG: hypothetical protein H0T76_15790 [Nannocystis sp.]|nr:hypothetical protein [Nannocystis sp.]MBA3547945.1 hypothetical protein [Nannocystis sp.]
MCAARDEPGRAPGAGSAGLTIASTVALFVLTIGVDLAADTRRVFGYLAADAFYYLTVARNIGDHGSPSFDGVHPTNGYQPLWQWILGPLHALVEALGASQYVLPMLVLLCIAAIAGGLVLLGRALTRPDGHLSPLFPLVVPGVCALLSTPLFDPRHDAPAFNEPATARPVFTTLWSFANGMETGALLLVFAGGLLWCVRRPQVVSVRAALGLAGLAFLLTLARLDHVFFAAALLAAMMASGPGASRRRALLAAGVFGALLALFLLANKLAFGAALPISGAAKSTFPQVSGTSSGALVRMFTDPPRAWVSWAARLVQMLLPALIAALYVPCTLRLVRVGWRVKLRLRAGCERIDWLLLWLTPAVVVLALYDFLFVRIIHHGNWYFPVSTLFASLAVISTLDRVPALRRLARSRRGMILWLALCQAGVLAYFFRAHHHPRHQEQLASFYYDEAPRVRAFYGDTPPRLLELDDGIVGYATGFPAMSATGLALDARAARAMQTGRLPDLAIARGFDRFTSLFYLDTLEGMASGKDKRAARWRFTLEYYAADPRFAVYRLQRREPAAGP